VFIIKKGEKNTLRTYNNSVLACATGIQAKAFRTIFSDTNSLVTTAREAVHTFCVGIVAVDVLARSTAEGGGVDSAEAPMPAKPHTLSDKIFDFVIIA